MDEDWPKLALAMCDRHFGVGSDGILLIRPSSVADYRMQIFNPDGSEAEACGNGIRMFTKYLVEQDIAPPQTAELMIETLGAVGKVSVTRHNGTVNSVRASMGVPRLKPEQVPVALNGPGPVMDHTLEVDGRDVKVTCVSVGNPHAVSFIDTPVDEYPLHEVGPKVEHHPFFPQRVNFEIVNVIDRTRVVVRVWERGVGETLACGTGACAVGIAARLHDATNSPVDVALPGGVLEIEWDGEGEVFMSGPAEYVFNGEWDEA
jgi:diaminopimelate epimerase